MKKKAFVFLAMVATFMCLFAFSVFATDVEWGEITYGGQCNTPTIIDTTSRIKMSDGKTYPAYYFIWNTTDLTIQFDKAKVTKADGSNYTISDIIMLEIPNGVQTFYWQNEGAYLKNLQNAVNLVYVKFPSSLVDPSSNALANCTSLVTADLSNVTLTKLSAGMFYNCTSLVNVILPDTITSLSSEMNTTGYGVFEGCKSLESLNLPNVTYIGRASFKNCKKLDFKIPDKVSAIGDYAFAGSGVTSVDLPSSITAIPAYAYANTGITSLTIPDQITTIGEYAFSGCLSLTTLNPCNSKSLTSMGSNVFNGCTALTVAYFPTYYSTVPAHTFVDCTALEVTYISSYVTSIETKAFTNTPWTLVFKYTGTKAQIEALQANSYSGLQSGTGLLFEKDAETGALPDYRRFAFYGYDFCEIFYNAPHDCSSDSIMGVEYTSYLSKGTYFYSCPACEGYAETTPSASALFVNLGYSASEYDGAQISVNYRVNEKAISEYERITGEKVSYGVFAVTKKNIEKNDIFDADGKALEGVIAADITGTGFNLFTLKITGFTEAQKKLPFAMGAFVGTEKDGATEYSYLQIAAPAEGEKYYFATYNEVAKLTPSDDEESAQ